MPVKKFVLSVSMGLCLAASAWAGGGTNLVTDTAVAVLGRPNPRGAPAWTASAVSTAGSTVKSAGWYYLALNTGTNGVTAPTGERDFVSGQVTWRSCLNAQRKGLSLANLGTTDTTFSWTDPAEVDRGVILASGQKIVFSGVEDTPQAVIKAICAASTTNKVAVSEW